MLGALFMLTIMGPPEAPGDQLEPAAAEEPAAVEEPVAAEEPAAVEEPVVAEELAVVAPPDLELPPPQPVLAGAQPEPPPPVLVEPPPRVRRIKRCLPGADPCYLTTSSRLLLAAFGLLSTATSTALVFSAGDRNRLGDPAVSFSAGGVIAMSAAAIGGVASLLGGDGPTLHDRITVPTFALSVGLGGSSVTDEAVPYTLSGFFAPTLQFPKDLGRLRLLGRIGGDVGSQLVRDPSPQAANGGSFPEVLSAKAWNLDLGLDLAVRLPYPLARRRPAWLGQFELRYKPLFFFTRETLTLGDEARVSQRVALTPLNFGLRWHISPRQRFTFYLGPRWDLIGHGEPDNVASGGPELGPIYSESWFDLDVPLRPLARAKRASVVGQFTLGYIHSRFYGHGINFRSTVGFLGHMVAQFAVRVRPLDSPVAYQFSAGARIGGGMSPFVRMGIVLPDIGGKR